MRELISTLKKQEEQAGNELSNILPKSPHARKKPPPPPPPPPPPEAVTVIMMRKQDPIFAAVF